MKELANPALFPFVDSALPIGSFAYSQGLESAFSLGLVNNPKSLQRYMLDYLDLISRSELPYINSLFQESESCSKQHEDMLGEYDALLSIPTIHHSSVSQGQSWIRLFEQLPTGEFYQTFVNWLKKKTLPIHALFIYAVGMKDRAFSLSETGFVFLYNNLRDQINAAIRLGVIGPLQAQVLLHDLLPTIDKHCEGISETGYQQAIRNAPMIDIFQAHHHTLYSKLFQS